MSLIESRGEFYQYLWTQFYRRGYIYIHISVDYPVIRNVNSQNN
jgi:hypothetical protein